MLPIPVLDDETFEEIASQAKSMIPRFCPDWTDFNEHDPGITFLELFAFFKEIQQYHLDQIGPANRQKYLKLLGMSRLHRSPARTGAVVSGREERFLPEGIRLMAGDLPFETLAPAWLGQIRLLGGFSWDGSYRRDFEGEGLTDPGSRHLLAFGRNPGPEAAWYLRLDRFPSGEEPFRLHLWIGQDAPVRRNPAPHGMIPLVQLAWEYLDREGWKPFQLLEDTTRGLLFTGDLVLTGGTPCSWEEAPHSERKQLGAPGCWLRVRLTGGSYDVPPVVTGISCQMVPVRQQETRATWRSCQPHQGRIEDSSLLAAAGEYALFCQEDGLWYPRPARRERDGRYTRFVLEDGGEEDTLLLLWRQEFGRSRHLGIGDGFPNQSFRLDGGGQLTDAFRLLIAEAEGSGWSLWQQVEDFDASGPEDRHYVLDGEEGVVSFGDCIHGMAPEGEILIVGETVSMGAGGNVKSGRIQEIHPEDLAFCGLTARDVQVVNPDDAQDGQDREGMDDCFARCRRMLRQTDRAVTYEDYERLVKETPGLMIPNCKAVPVNQLPRPDGSFEENCITLVVEPYSPGTRRSLNPAYTRNILGHLENRRMLGSKISLISPEYVRIIVYAEILAKPHYLDARARIQAAIAEFFQKGWDFGSPVRYSELYGTIDTLDCVQAIESLTIDAQGRGIARSVGGDVILPFNGLAVLQSASCQVRPAE